MLVPTEFTLHLDYLDLVVTKIGNNSWGPVIFAI